MHKDISSGGTVDVAVDQRDIFTTNGRGWGCTTMDDTDRKILEFFWGKNVLDTFRKGTTDIYETFRDFEFKKRTITPSLDENIVIKVFVSLKDTLKMFNCGREIRGDILAEFTFLAQKMKDKLRVDRTICLLKASNEYIRNSFNNPKINNIKAVGFSHSMSNQEKIRETCPTTKMEIPSDTGLEEALPFGYKLGVGFPSFDCGIQISWILQFEGYNSKYKHHQQNGGRQYLSHLNLKHKESVMVGAHSESPMLEAGTCVRTHFDKINYDTS